MVESGSEGEPPNAGVAAAAVAGRSSERLGARLPLGDAPKDRDGDNADKEEDKKSRAEKDEGCWGGAGPPTAALDDDDDDDDDDDPRRGSCVRGLGFARRYRDEWRTW